MGLGIGEVILILFAMLVGLIIAVRVLVTGSRRAPKHSDRVSELESRVERLERQVGWTTEPTAPKSRE